jgi:SAM-dependent methyltransferase
MARNVIPSRVIRKKSRIEYIWSGLQIATVNAESLVPSMTVMRNILLRAFGRPQGLLGKLGGIIMARMNADAGAWASDLLEVRPNDSVLEVGFGPGVTMHHLSNLATSGHIAGVDQSLEMFEQARARNAIAIESGRVDLRHGSVESLPFDDNSFDKAVAINTRCKSGRTPSLDCEKCGGS